MDLTKKNAFIYIPDHIHSIRRVRLVEIYSNDKPELNWFLRQTASQQVASPYHSWEMVVTTNFTAWNKNTLAVNEPFIILTRLEISSAGARMAISNISPPPLKILKETRIAYLISTYQNLKHVSSRCSTLHLDRGIIF